MSFPKVTALVPKDEHFDSTALNEGIWLSAGHLNAIENALAAAAANDTTQASRITELTSQLATKQNDLTAAQSSLATANTTISGLQGEIVTLKGTPAGPIVQTSKNGGDELPNTGKQLSAVTKEANELRALSGKQPIKA